MPTGIDRDELRKLTDQGAQLVEVLPAEEYEWARLPGAVSLPLKELDDRVAQLESAAPGTEAAALMRFGVTTVRPSEQVADLVHRLGHAQISRVVVTRPDGTLVGMFFADDVAALDEEEEA